MKFLFKKDIYIRSLFNTFERKKLILKFFFKNNKVTIKKKKQLSVVFYKIPQKATHVRAKNRCLVTGHGRGVLRKYKMCRQQFKLYVNEGHFLGTRKIS